MGKFKAVLSQIGTVPCFHTHTHTHIKLTLPNMSLLAPSQE